MSLLSLGIHSLMLADGARNRALAAGIAAAVRPGDVVADVGGGTGVLSILAAQAGAAQVYCIEGSALAALAVSTVRDNGLADRVTVIAKRSQDVELPERCDLVISETLGFLGLDEGFREVMVDARTRFLKPGGRVLPQALHLMAAPIGATGDLVWPGLDGVDLGRAQRMFARIPRRGHVPPAAHLAPAQRLLSLDCARMPGTGPLTAGARFTCTAPAKIAALALWFDAPLGSGVVLTSASAEPSNHWGHGVLPLEVPLVAAAGRSVCLAVEIFDTPGAFRLDWRLAADHAPAQQTEAVV